GVEVLRWTIVESRTDHYHRLPITGRAPNVEQYRLHSRMPIADSRNWLARFALNVETTRHRSQITDHRFPLFRCGLKVDETRSTHYSLLPPVPVAQAYFDLLVFSIDQ